jgi:hypothetical protein
MVLWLRGLAALSAVVVLSSAAAGCGDGVSSSEANVLCQQEQMSIADCFDTTVFAACVACYESCGTSCQSVGTSCPLTYECPGSSNGGAGGGGGSSGTTQ